MSKIIRVDSISQYNALREVTTLHPLVSVIDYKKASPMPKGNYNMGLYAIFLKSTICGAIKYGHSVYDYQEGTLVFVAPGQIIGVPEQMNVKKTKAWALVFHPDLIRGTSLGKNIHQYSFFSYEINEALHLSEKERQIVKDCFSKIQYELEQSIDKHSKNLIASNIELFLNYCRRFYDRQFITRDTSNKGVIEKFETLLNQYFKTDKPQQLGLPSVSWCAKELHLSANYFGDLIKKETGISAQEYIQTKVIDLAKERVFEMDKSLSQISLELGFKYPQHFSRLFKQKTGVSPVEYRVLN